MSAERILELCDSWCSIVKMAENSLGICGESEKYRLLINGIQFHDLDSISLKAAVVGLSKVMLLPGLNSVVVQDHYFLWSWCAELILNRDANVFDVNEYELRTLFGTCVRASLAGCVKPAKSFEEAQQIFNRNETMSHNEKYFVQESSLVLAYLVFPLLEGTCKKLCSSYITMGGDVLQPFVVPYPKGGDKKYNPNGKIGKDRCSSLRDLLYLTSSLYKSSELELLKDHIKQFGDGNDAFDVIYNWRNQSLHGTTSFQTIGGTLLNLVIFLLLSQLGGGFEKVRSETLEQCCRNYQSENRSSRSYYPPY